MLKNLLERISKYIKTNEKLRLQVIELHNETEILKAQLAMEIEKRMIAEERLDGKYKKALADKAASTEIWN